VDDEYRLMPKTVYRLTAGLAAFGGLLILIALFTMGKSGATLTGHVTHRGKPVIWGSVIVVGPDGNATAGRIQPDGTYTVENVPPVAVNVAVVSRDPLVQHNMEEIRRNRNRAAPKSWEPVPVDRKQWFPLPERYADPQTSGLTVLLSKGTNRHDIELP
jgi:hypothetical protein